MSIDILQLNLNKPLNKTRVIVAMSGGVDSTTVAVYLHKMGYEVIGITLQLYSGMQGSNHKTCCSGQDIEDARSVATRFGFPHYVIDKEGIFEKEVIQNFADKYANGYTPIPCVTCNQTVKFRDLVAVAKKLKGDILVTGHYVRHKYVKNNIELHVAVDQYKDQSYFLFATTKEQLQYLRFPLGNFHKTETRKMAKEFGIAIANKPDSQDICFVKNRSYVEIVNKYRPDTVKPGPIKHVNGQTLGYHKGTANFTIGQRSGLGISYHEPLYVTRIETETSTIWVGNKQDLDVRDFQISCVNWIAGYAMPERLQARVKIRSGIVMYQAEILKHENIFKVSLLEKPDTSISPGQACVIYNDSQILGGGWICKY
ncbi:MAG: tRNA (5-methylaminomethyl-2-thiouridylate)-methyltransferase [Candidatus Xenolissoclinum pacificiensis L6]|uniref:tRNA-specific 2-thiouridylase MnmA n=1 Tax=Candidatus Xenolissoclinum pacificiensis L6 TaxID=1401685 RepID=W2V1C6_9RICK|nr:MAG: tRNA (5-methylaminomethyl-2-thiouridylate)-methyltransferase [Candidatus Xenolissoclinum pacificiensis L6]